MERERGLAGLAADGITSDKRPRLPVPRRSLPHSDGLALRMLALPAIPASLSPAHFSRQFKATFCESPHQYLLTRRLERAAGLLCTTDWTVAAICFAVGAQSIGSFTTSFRRVFGTTPLTYRATYPPAERYVRIPRCVALAYGRPQNRTFREDKTAVAP
jgi:AraC-like DNA-binding protein